MAYQKLQVERALKVIPSDTINIPNVAGPTAQRHHRRDYGKQARRQLGFVHQQPSWVHRVQHYRQHCGYGYGCSTTRARLASVRILWLTERHILIYADDNNGCVLQSGLAGAIRVLTIGGDDVTFSVVAGAFVPVQVKRVLDSGTMSPNDIIALW